MSLVRIIIAHHSIDVAIALAVTMAIAIAASGQ